MAYDQLIPVIIEAIKQHVKEYEKNKAETNAGMNELKEKIDKLQLQHAQQGLNEVHVRQLKIEIILKN